MFIVIVPLLLLLWKHQIELRQKMDCGETDGQEGKARSTKITYGSCVSPLEWQSCFSPCVGCGKSGGFEDMSAQVLWILNVALNDSPSCFLVCVDYGKTGGQEGKVSSGHLWILNVASWMTILHVFLLSCPGPSTVILSLVSSRVMFGHPQEQSVNFFSCNFWVFASIYSFFTSRTPWTGGLDFLPLLCRVLPWLLF